MTDYPQQYRIQSAAGDLLAVRPTVWSATVAAKWQAYLLLAPVVLVDPDGVECTIYPTAGVVS
jgi:hypothetical protein